MSGLKHHMLINKIIGGFNMNYAKYIDHTLLKPESTRNQIDKIIEEAKAFNFKSICINPTHVKYAAEQLKGSDVLVCTVIGFPNGYSTTAVKCFEAEDAIYNGADEIDMVINIGWAKDGNFDGIRDEVAQVKKFCGDRVLKVIIETCLLTDDEKVKVCAAVEKGGADYIKTSTGFSTGGATVQDVSLLKDCIMGGMKIKASGGISSIHDGERLIEAGASRLGTSRIVKLVKEEEN